MHCSATSVWRVEKDEDDDETSLFQSEVIGLHEII